MNRQLALLHDTPTNDILTELRTFSDFGEVTQIESRNGICYFINEFWTARQRQAHRLHEISYRACFKPQLPKFFIDRLTRPGDVVYDPFMGRGTTPIEAALRGRIPYGNDINPLSSALARPRINSPTLAQVLARLKNIPWQSFQTVSSQELLVFFHPQTLAQIEGLRAWLLARDAAGGLDPIDQWIRMIAINRLTGHSPGFFSVYTLPPNQAVSVGRQKIINEKRQQIPPKRDVAGIIAKKSKNLLSQGGINSSASLFLTGPSCHTPEISDAVVSLSVTSPPFLDIVNYEADNWMRCWFLEVDTQTVNISKHRSVSGWEAFIAKTLVEMVRVTKRGGHIAFEVGEVRNGKVKLEDHVIAAAQNLPLHLLGVMINQQEFTKTSNCWGVSNNKNGTNSNRIVIFRRG